MTPTQTESPLLSAAEAVSELRRLGDLYPPPNLSDWLADREWLLAEAHKPEFEPYFGRFVAALEMRIVGAGDDELILRIRVSQECGVHPERLVVSFFGEYR